MNSRYFLKSGGKTLGPFSREQLDSLQARGRFKSDHLISSDRKSWKPVDEFLSDLEPHSISVPPITADGEWYYAENGNRVGPLSQSEMKQLFKTGQLSQDDLVWREGFQDWVPGISVPEFQSSRKPATPLRQLATSGAALQRICLKCGTQDPVGGEYCPRCGSHYRLKSTATSGSIELDNRKDRIVAALLALILGGLGIHHFYLGNTLLGVVYILFCWTFIPSIVSLIEGILLLCTSTSAFNERYNVR